MKKFTFGSIILILTMIMILVASAPALADSASKHKQFTRDFLAGECTFSNTGGNPYFSIEPGTEIFLAGEEKGELIQVYIYVTSDTEDVSVTDIGTVSTRVVEEWEWEDGELTEISYNWFARCIETNDIYYFGEEVDIYEYPEEGPPIITHEGAWRAGEDGAMPGIMMPGTFLLGARYYQEIAEEAMDRGENIEMGLTVYTEAGMFENCVKVEETTPLEPSSKDIKVYAPGSGIIVDQSIERVPPFELP